MQAHFFITGFVQGVGYRQFVRSHARKLKLSGWVKNLLDGRVEVLLQGEKKEIEELVIECKKGPFLSQVDHVEVIWEEESSHNEDFLVIK